MMSSSNDPVPEEGVEGQPEVEDKEEEEDEGYTPGKKVDIKTLVEKDQEDESLRKYKEQLLGSAASAELKSNDPRIVVIQSFGVVFPERGDSIEFDMSTKEGVERLKNESFVLKEGCQYQFKIRYCVQNDIVSGLRFQNVVKKRGIKVDKNKYMIGSFAPREEAYEHTFPTETAPTGWLARGHYKCHCTFVDDDKMEHLAFDFQFDIKKEWE